MIHPVVVPLIRPDPGYEAGIVDHVDAAPGLGRPVQRVVERLHHLGLAQTDVTVQDPELPPGGWGEAVDQQGGVRVATEGGEKPVELALRLLEESVEAAPHVLAVVAVGEREEMLALEREDHDVRPAGVQAARRVKDFLAILSEAGLVDLDSQLVQEALPDQGIVDELDGEGRQEGDAQRPEAERLRGDPLDRPAEERPLARGGGPGEQGARGLDGTVALAALECRDQGSPQLFAPVTHSSSDPPSRVSAAHP